MCRYVARQDRQIVGGVSAMRQFIGMAERLTPRIDRANGALSNGCGPGGIPLYIEELSKSIVESSLLLADHSDLESLSSARKRGYVAQVDAQARLSSPHRSRVFLPIFRRYTLGGRPCVLIRFLPHIAKPHGLRQLRTLGGVGESNHRIVVVQTPFLALLFRCHPE